MSPMTQTILQAGAPTLAVIIGIVVEARAFKRMREQIQNLIDDMDRTIRSDSGRPAERLR